MAWSEAEAVCGKHPNENPQPGICPSCLREGLSRIAGNYYKINNTNCASSSDPSVCASPVYYYYYSSAYSSGGSSPVNRRHRGGAHHRVASDIMDSIYNFALSGRKELKKSRSMAFTATRTEKRDHGEHIKKKGGFWNKLLLRSARKKHKF